MSDFLFDEFQPVSAKQWKQKIQADLKGADYNDSLIWKSPEGIDVKPFYNYEDIGKIKAAPETRASDWKTGQLIFAGNTQNANAKALDVLNRGAESIFFHIPSDQVSVNDLLKGIDLATVTVYIALDFLSEAYIDQFLKISKHTDAGIFLNIDILGHLVQTGNWYFNQDADHEALERILTRIHNSEKHGVKSVLGVDLSRYQNAGATLVQQLAYTLAHANEYLNFLNDKGLLQNTSQNMLFHVSVGGNYFFEIAKLRALHLLWKQLTASYGLSQECHIIAKPGSRNKTLYDYNVNMLRSTTECMSAVIGGAHMVYNLPYDSVYHKDNEFGERIARNQLLILKHESYFDLVDNPADGSYYIESITQQLAQKALDIFKKIEIDGGFLHQLKAHSIQKKIRESAQKEQHAFEKKHKILIGTNKYPNEKDKMKEHMELYPFVKTKVRKTLIEPILEKRLAEAMEKERLDKES